MHPIRTIALSIGIVFFAVPAFAQPAPAQKTDGVVYDPKAKAILDEVSKTAKSYSTITATFSITMTKPDKTTDTKNGTVIMKSGKYKITLENTGKDGKVYHEEYYNDSKTTWVYSEKDKEVTIDNAPDPTKKNNNSISPNDIFTIHEKGFKYHFVKEGTLNGRTVQYIDLVPEQPEKKNYHTVKLTIDKVKKQIISVVFLNKDGSKTTYTIKTLSPNLDVPDSTFQFDMAAHPGTDSIDVR